MNSQNEIYFGDINTFAIRYVPGYSTDNGQHYFAYCHLVLGGQIIGEKDEVCLLNSWKLGLEELKIRIASNLNSLKNIEFNNRSDNELFELLIKANQLTEEFKPEFSYLPVLEHATWINCHVSIDETMDAFEIFMIESNSAIKFLWKGWREPAALDKIGQLFSITADNNFVVQTIESCLNKIESDYWDSPPNDFSKSI